MKKIFSLPSISINSKKPSEFYPHDVDDLLAHANSSIDLTDEKKIKLEKLQSRLSALYEELDKVMIKEEELTVLKYRNKKRKIEPVSNFKSSLESLQLNLKALKAEPRCSSSKSLCIDNLKDNYGEANGDDQAIRCDRPAANSDLKDETHKDELDYNSNYNDLTSQNDVKETAFSKFYLPSSETNLNDQLNADQPPTDADEVSTNRKSDKQFSKQLDKELSKLDRNDSKSRRKLSGSKSFNVIANRSKPINSPIIEQDENSLTDAGHSAEQTSLLKKKINFLKQKLTNVASENDRLKTSLKRTIESENEMKLNCRQLEAKIVSQKEKIERLQNRLTESVSGHNKLKVEHEQFKAEMQIEREKFTKFVMQETRGEQSGSKKVLKQKLKEKDQLIASLHLQIEDLKNLKNKCLTIDLVEKNQLIASQQISIDQAIKNISIYQTNNVPDMLMINLDSSSQLGNLSTRPTKQSSAGQLSNSISQSNSSIRSDSGQSINQLNKSTQSHIQPNQKPTIDESAALNGSGQSTDQLNGTLKQFCEQINRLQTEFAAVDEEEKRSFMLKIEEFVLKNMRKLVVDKVDSFFDTLQLYLAQLKFEIIQFAVENEKRQQQQSGYSNGGGHHRKSKGSSLDHNNNSSLAQNKEQNNGFRNNLQSRTVERRMVELRRSIETYLKSYLVHILLQMQDQAN